MVTLDTACLYWRSQNDAEAEDNLAFTSDTCRDADAGSYALGIGIKKQADTKLYRDLLTVVD